FLILETSTYPVIYRSENEKFFLDSRDGRKLLFPSLEDEWSVHLSVIVPAFDEALRLPPMLDECMEFLEERRKKDKKFRYEIIVVSDGSRDDTVKVGLEYTKKFGPDVVRVLELEKNRGKGGAVRLGMMSSRGALLLFADADGATQFSELSKLEQKMQQITKHDYLKEPELSSQSLGLVCGSRAHLEAAESAEVNRSVVRIMLMHAFHWLVATTAVASIADTQCGFKLLTRRSAQMCFGALHIERWAFDVELLYIAERLSIPLGEVPVNWTEMEGSKIVPVLSWLQMGKDLLLNWLRYKIGAWKIRQKES
ncbi:hypothetical protein AAG570_005580, partial [Ranatra chinensis]